MNVAKKIFYITLSIIMFAYAFTIIVKANTVKVTTETLNLREEPSTESDIVAQISSGEECEVIEDEEDWYEVKYGEYTGYISKEYAELVGGTQDDNSQDNKQTTTEDNNSDGTSNEQTASEVSAGTTKIGTITKNTSIKIVPLISSSNLENIKENEKVTVIEQINNWVYIQTDEISGWVRSDCISIQTQNNNQTDDNNNDKNTTDSEEGNTEPSDNGQENGSGNETDTIEYEPKTMYTEDLVNIRKGPSTTSDIIMVVEQNTALEVIGEEGDWYKVNTSEGEAYVTKSAMSNSKVGVTNRGGVDRTNNTNNLEGNSSNTNNETSTIANNIVSYAKKFLGVPYVYGGASSSGFDCSGFTMYVFDNFGISMGHGAQMQSKLGKAVEANKNSKTSLLENLKVGDLVFFLDYETMDEIGHCGIYIGNGDFIHASSGSGYCVKINSLLPGEYYNTRYCAARRVL